MSRKVGLFMLALLWAGVLVAPAHGAEAQQIFEEKCATCHREGGKSDPVDPSSKAGMVWVRYFKRGEPRKHLYDQVPPEEARKVIRYLVKHAADSDQPLTAVIPK